MARFYNLAVEPTLFGLTSVVREWGRIGSNGHRRIDLYDGEAEALEAYRQLSQQKRRRGYIE